MKFSLKSAISSLKPFLRWAILAGICFFVAKTLRVHWQNVTAISIENIDWGYLAIALLVTLLAHCWTGWVWGWILSFLKHPVAPGWSIRVYLTTNIAKYIPGNIWHFYGRIRAAEKEKISLAIATISILLESLLMAAAAVIWVLLSYPQFKLGWQFLLLGGVLVGIHPIFLNPALAIAGKLKGRNKHIATAKSTPQVQNYPFLPLLGEFIFLGLRGSGFLMVVLALYPLKFEQVPQLFGVFIFAWLLGMIVPGAPGGIGVFEGTAIALLQGEFVIAIAVYRLIGTSAEAIGAAIAWLIKQ
ncbi:lysylphosphatidylglycerol synthase domain-containing protein [Spirulina sp. 06S082]|uniref:lysylphosphatidylglycerol synthase domain-containing protein n=1 Tax=Spirulina sp. 06S082 TaxID=3110248 RepID=UPI002B209A46|nr:lysylphosphatidylglycerol synthase domain-containing protein [Spirulina sp. 06S082]MEA5469140.1 lysylphosphatidylglycerol synthase domain-containing protein [Spirulina sp. 06S082]